MKSIKIVALILGTIALLPSASFAQNVSGKTQEANLNSVTLGNGNVNVTETQQRILDLQQSGQGGANIGATTQTVNGHTITVGDHNLDVKQVVQEAISGQNNQ
jgi:hypothetical protein